jgi:hypothetical protein
MLKLNSHLYVLVGKQRNEKSILSLSLELIKVSGYDFPYPCDVPVTVTPQWTLSLTHVWPAVRHLTVRGRGWRVSVVAKTYYAYQKVINFSNELTLTR